MSGLHTTDWTCRIVFGNPDGKREGAPVDVGEDSSDEENNDFTLSRRARREGHVVTRPNSTCTTQPYLSSNGDVPKFTGNSYTTSAALDHEGKLDGAPLGAELVNNDDDVLGPEEEDEQEQDGRGVDGTFVASNRRI